MKLESETGTTTAATAILLITRVSHGLKPLCQGQRVAIVTSWRSTFAARDRVPCGIGPFDRTPVGHAGRIGGCCDRMGAATPFCLSAMARAVRSQRSGNSLGPGSVVARASGDPARPVEGFSNRPAANAVPTC